MSMAGDGDDGDGDGDGDASVGDGEPPQLSPAMERELSRYVVA